MLYLTNELKETQAITNVSTYVSLIKVLLIYNLLENSVFALYPSPFSLYSRVFDLVGDYEFFLPYCTYYFLIEM